MVSRTKKMKTITKTKVCPVCQNSGYYTTHNPFGSFSTQRNCGCGANPDFKEKVIIGKSEILSIAEFKALQKNAKSQKQSNKIADILTLNAIPYVQEHQFIPERKFRFDFAIKPLELKIAIEYEGLFSEKSRHTTATGFSNDCTKYNIAQIEGWKVLRYTALNYQRCIEDVKYLLNQP